LDGAKLAQSGGVDEPIKLSGLLQLARPNWARVRFAGAILVTSSSVSPAKISEPTAQARATAGADTSACVRPPYHLVGNAEADQFVVTHRSVSQVLSEVYGKISYYFGSEATLRLELFTDPEADQYQQLVVRIKSPLPFSEKMQQLDRFDSEWWAQALSRAQNYLVVTLDFS